MGRRQAGTVWCRGPGPFLMSVLVYFSETSPVLWGIKDTENQSEGRSRPIRAAFLPLPEGQTLSVA